MNDSDLNLDALSSTKPYLVRALYEWILDNGLTPHLLVDAQYPGTQVPQEFVQEGQIVLNLAPSAVRNLALGNDLIQFGARFGGVARDLYIPADAVLGIFARENHQGMVFPQPEYPSDGSDRSETSPETEGLRSPVAGPSKGERADKGEGPGKSKGGPRLRVVK